MAVDMRSVSDSGTETDLPGDGPDPGSESVQEADTEEEAEALPLDQVFDVLKNKRRRTVLRYLDEHEEPISLGELSEHVAADENDIPVAQISSRERKCAYVGLYQCHLPKMDDMDIIEFNQNRGLIEAGPNEEQLKQYLDWADEPERPWPLYYATVAGAGVLSGLFAQAGGSGLAGVVTCVAALVGVAAIAFFQLYVDDEDRSLDVPYIRGRP